jgi:hypothetical protein
MIDHHHHRGSVLTTSWASSRDEEEFRIASRTPLTCHSDTCLLQSSHCLEFDQCNQTSQSIHTESVVQGFFFRDVRFEEAGPGMAFYH